MKRGSVVPDFPALWHRPGVIALPRFSPRQCNQGDSGSEPGIHIIQRALAIPMDSRLGTSSLSSGM